MRLSCAPAKCNNRTQDLILSPELSALSLVIRMPRTRDCAVSPVSPCGSYRVGDPLNGDGLGLQHHGVPGFPL